MGSDKILLIQIGRYAIFRTGWTYFVLMKAEKKDEKGEWNYWDYLNRI